MQYITGIFRNASRVRLFFDETPADLAFQSFWFAVETSGYESPPITVQAALAVIGQPTTIELVLDQELIPGVLYLVTIAQGVASDTSATEEPTVAELRMPGHPEHQRLTGTVIPDLFGEDIQWAGSDWRETADGDLAVTGGLENLMGAQRRRAMSEGLAWSRTYGLKPRRYVDAPEGTLAPLGAEAGRQAMLDDRVESARGSVFGDRIEIMFEPVGIKQTQVVSVGR